MPASLRFVPKKSVITGWDFSTGAVKCLAFDLEGNVLAQTRMPTDLWDDGGVSELNLAQLEGQARASTRAIAKRLASLGRLDDWVAGGISATHHTAGRLDAEQVQVRRAICWNDASLIPYHAAGLKRLGGQKKARELTGGPWAVRYSLSHLIKDEATLSEEDWKRTSRILSHGSLAAGYLTGNFDAASVSSAASTGIMDLRTGKWRRDMLDALISPELRVLAYKGLPKIVDHNDPVGTLHQDLVPNLKKPPLIFPTSDDQQAGLVGGGAVDAGQVAIILGNSAVVNASSDRLPTTDQLDAMRLNWGPYLWMRCYTNGALFLDRVIGPNPDWSKLESDARAIAPGCGGVSVLPFIFPEPSLGVLESHFAWDPAPPKTQGERYRAALEALAYLVALGVQQHEKAGQEIARVTVSGGIARSGLMCEILASVLDQPLELLQSEEGPALGAAVTALASLENHRRKQKGEQASYGVGDAVAQMVKFRGRVEPQPAWKSVYSKGMKQFEKLAGLKKIRG